MKKIKMQQQATGKNLKEAFNEFIKYCRVRSLSDATLSFYEECFEDTFSFQKYVFCLE